MGVQCDIKALPRQWQGVLPSVWQLGAHWLSLSKVVSVEASTGSRGVPCGVTICWQVGWRCCDGPIQNVKEASGFQKAHWRVGLQVGAEGPTEGHCMDIMRIWACMGSI